MGPKCKILPQLLPLGPNQQQQSHPVLLAMTITMASPKLASVEFLVLLDNPPTPPSSKPRGCCLRKEVLITAYCVVCVKTSLSPVKLDSTLSIASEGFLQSISTWALSCPAARSCCCLSCSDSNSSMAAKRSRYCSASSSKPCSMCQPTALVGICRQCHHVQCSGQSGMAIIARCCQSCQCPLCTGTCSIRSTIKTGCVSSSIASFHIPRLTKYTDR